MSDCGLFVTPTAIFAFSYRSLLVCVFHELKVRPSDVAERITTSMVILHIIIKLADLKSNILVGSHYEASKIFLLASIKHY